MDDDALMIRTAQGEETAFHLLVQRWERDVRSFLVHMLGSVEEAEDVAQDTFVKVYRQAGKYQGSGRFKSWLFRIAGNLARSRLRRRSILRWVSFDPVRHERGAPGLRPDQALEARQREAAIRTALDHLPARQKQALVLHRFQGMSYREVAVAMDTTLAGVESLIQRALARMRTELADRGDLL
jgi:RNA polymerase sigma-70 factor (ECF subfamily)